MSRTTLSGPKAEARRQRVLGAALDVITERGIPEMRIADVATRAGMSPGHVMYYFGSRAELLVAVLDWNEDRFHAALEADLARKRSAWRRLDAVIRASIPSGRGDPHWLLWLEVWAMAPHDDELSENQRLQEGRFHDVLARVIRQGQASREFERSVDADRAAIRLSALIDGLAIRVAVGAVGIDRSLMLRLATDEARSLLAPTGRR